MKTFALMLASLSFAFFLTACGEDAACTAEESNACTSKHTTCAASCGVGDEPGFAACMDSCAQKLCDCQSACGNSCDENQ